MYTSFILATFWFGNVKQLHLGKRRPCPCQGSGGTLKDDLVGDHVLTCSSHAFVKEPRWGDADQRSEIQCLGRWQGLSRDAETPTAQKVRKPYGIWLEVKKLKKDGKKCVEMCQWGFSNERCQILQLGRNLWYKLGLLGYRQGEAV